MESESGSFQWYVALTQLPGMPVRLRDACMEELMEVLKRLPVVSRRQHAWHSVRPAASIPGIPVAELDNAFADSGLGASAARA